MRSMMLVAAILTLGACGTETSTHVNALSGKACDPNHTYMPHKTKAPSSNPKCQGTSNGDNCDDLSSGKIDCIGDGNSGQGDDKKHNCQFPQPGCDELGCCDDDLVEPPPDHGGHGDDGAGCDGGAGGGGGGGGGTPPEPTDPTGPIN